MALLEREEPMSGDTRRERLREARRLIREVEAERRYEAEVKPLGRRVKRAEEAYRKAAARAEALRVERNRAIVAALADGLTQQDVSRVTGLGRARISQILRAESPDAVSAARGTTHEGKSHEHDSV